MAVIGDDVLLNFTMDARAHLRIFCGHMRHLINEKAETLERSSQFSNFIWDELEGCKSA